MLELGVTTECDTFAFKICSRMFPKPVYEIVEKYCIIIIIHMHA